MNNFSQDVPAQTLMLANACFPTAPDIQSVVMACWSAIHLVLVTRDNRPCFQPGSILSKQTAVKILYSSSNYLNVCAYIFFYNIGYLCLEVYMC